MYIFQRTCISDYPPTDIASSFNPKLVTYMGSSHIRKSRAHVNVGEMQVYQWSHYHFDTMKQLILLCISPNLARVQAIVMEGWKERNMQSIMT